MMKSEAVLDIGIIICAYGRHDLTRAVLQDLGLLGDDIQICIIDNLGTLPNWGIASVSVIRPSWNLGWARGSNLGIRFFMDLGVCRSVLLLNNDVRLSPQFLNGLRNARDATLAGVIGPMYDHNWPQ